jgi:hypothetical protein
MQWALSNTIAKPLGCLQETRSISGYVSGETSTRIWMALGNWSFQAVGRRSKGLVAAAEPSFDISPSLCACALIYR